jgi:hypothetical protein
MANVQTSEVDAKFAPVDMGLWNLERWYVFERRTDFNYEKHKVEGDWKLKFIYPFMEITHDQ